VQQGKKRVLTIDFRNMDNKGLPEDMLPQGDRRQVRFANTARFYVYSFEPTAWSGRPGECRHTPIRSVVFGRIPLIIAALVG
jgi:hypothetical protein